MKLAIDSGHGLNTIGKQTLASVGPVIKEWTMSNRVTNHLIDILGGYDGIEILRLDDPTGRTDVPLKTRTDKANAWKADLLISNHHNAGINGGTGGGIVVYRYPGSNNPSKAMAQKLYDKLIARTGLKGNRSQPVAEANFHMLRESNMPALLLELGFMDSKTDYPIITKDAFSRQAAQGIVDYLVEQYGLKEKPKAVQTLAQDGKYFKVQVGAFSVKENAERLVAELKAKGYNPYIKYE